MTIDNYASRLQNISEEHELFLKKIWVFLFDFWGVPVDATITFDGNIIITDNDNTNKRYYSKHLSTLHPISSTDSFDYIKGEIHSAFKGMDPNESREAFWNMLRVDFPDSLIMRFTRARKWNLNNSIEMIAKTIEWRTKGLRADDIICGGERAAFDLNEKGFMNNIESQKAVISGFDKEGRPIVYVRAKLHRANSQNAEEMKKYCLLIIEEARLFLKEPIETATVIFDLTGFAISNMDYAPIKFLISCFEAHYPECLGHLFIHNAPWLFPSIWNIIKKWLDPQVASKITFTKSYTDLNQYISDENIPESLGGKSHCIRTSFKVPDSRYDTKMKDTVTKKKILNNRKKLIDAFIIKTKTWIECTDRNMSIEALRDRVSAGKELSINYLELDPYIRSRSIYDINGSLRL